MLATDAIDSSVNARGEAVRAAAVQLTATADKDRNLETADRLVRRAAARDGAAARRAAGEVVGARPRPRTLRDGAEPLDGPALDWARGDGARELGIDLVAGSIASASRARRSCATPACTSARTARSARSTARSTSSTSRSTGATTASPTHEEPGDEPVLTEAGGVERRPDHLLRPALPRALPRARRARRARPHRAQRVHRWPPRATTGRCSCAPARSRTRPSSSPPTRSASTRRGLRSGGRSHDRRSRGASSWPCAPDAETHVVADLDLDAQDAIRARLPALANRRPEVYALMARATPQQRGRRSAG